MTPANIAFENDLRRYESDRKFDLLIPKVTPWRPYAVMTSSAKMPSSCWGRYCNVAVVQTDGFGLPSMIAEHAKGVVRIVRFWGKLSEGGPRSAEGRAKAEAYALCARLNAKHNNGR